jgi:hypothetical protein
MIMGRFRDGTPLSVSATGGFTPAQLNNFRYDGLDAALQPDPIGPRDRLGLKCPFQSHIRKTNPRQSQNALGDTLQDIKKLEEEDLSHRIVRRGITYGPRVRSHTLKPFDHLLTDGVGLLFACFQRSIMKQYAFIQKAWANTATFKIPGLHHNEKTGLDPVIGQRPHDPKPVQHWRREYGGNLQPEPEHLDKLSLVASHPTPFEIGGFVRFRGGEFFFAPSLPFLRGE